MFDKPESVGTEIPASKEYSIVRKLRQHVSSKLFHVIIFTLIAFSIVAVLNEGGVQIGISSMTGGVKAKSVFAISVDK